MHITAIVRIVADFETQHYQITRMLNIYNSLNNLLARLLFLQIVTASFTSIMDELILKDISNEIEKKYDCKVISISFAQLLSLCVHVKIQFNEDFLYKPFDELPKPETIVFSERSIIFYKRVDLFDCIKKNCRLN